ncbi:MAG: ABC1 kinase family protein [Acidimicrobiales bacterium]
MVAAPASTAAETSVDLRRLSVGDAARLFEICVTLARHGAIVVARNGPFLVLRPDPHQGSLAAAVALRRSFTDLGPTFVKLGQLIASSPGLFPEVLSDEFRRLLDRMPAEPPERVRAVIEKELGAPINRLFADFDDSPLAAASIAQVHRATLPDGTPVAVKVRRPRLRVRIERDLRLLHPLAVVLQHAGPFGQMVNPVAIVEDLAVSLRSELDFRNEAAYMVEFARNLLASGRNPRVVVPRPVETMVAARVLVMTFVDGLPIDEVDLLRAAGHDLEDVLRVGVAGWVEAALVHGLFHGDVHAGNLFVTPEGSVAFLDFGIMGRLDESTRLVLLRLLPALLIEADYSSAVRAVFELGAISGPVTDIAAAAADLAGLVDPLRTARLSDIRYGEMLSQVIGIASRYGVRLPRELVLVVKQLVFFERYSMQLAPDYRLLADPAILAPLLGLSSESPPFRT